MHETVVLQRKGHLLDCFLCGVPSMGLKKITEQWKDPHLANIIHK